MAGSSERHYKYISVSQTSVRHIKGRRGVSALFMEAAELKAALQNSFASSHTNDKSAAAKAANFFKTVVEEQQITPPLVSVVISLRWAPLRPSPVTPPLVNGFHHPFHFAADINCPLCFAARPPAGKRTSDETQAVRASRDKAVPL